MPVIEDCFRRMAAGQVELMPRRRFADRRRLLRRDGGGRPGLGVAGLKSYTLVNGSLAFVVCLFDLETGALTATVEADRLGQIRTGAASGAAAKHLARSGSTSVGLIGAGWQAESQLAAIRAAVPSLERVLVSTRTPERAAAFADQNGAVVAGEPAEAGACDIVVTVTTAKRPVLQGAWLSEGALLCAVGPTTRAPVSSTTLSSIARLSSAATRSRMRELESGDLIEPIAAGRLSWDAVHEVHEVVAGTVSARANQSDIVIFKSNGIAPWDLAIAHEVVRRATERGVGTTVGAQSRRVTRLRRPWRPRPCPLRPPG